MNLKKTLCTLSGDDYSIIAQCKNDIQFRFMSIGAFVATIFAFCFVGCYFTFTKLFNTYFFALFVAIFFSWMITNIYLLILYTLSKNSFPHVSNKSAKLISVTIRVIFICFIAIIVSKPIETLIFSIPLDNEIEMYKLEQIEKYRQSTTDYFDAETKNLKSIIEKQTKLYGTDATSQVANYVNLLQKKESEKIQLISSMKELVSDSNYYLQSIIILNTKYRTCWLITLLTILIFLAPAYLKNFIADSTDYYSIKSSIENKLVKEEYATFKTKYNLILQDFKEYSKEKNLQFSEPYIDAPFNTIRKKDEREFLKEDDLIFDLYNA